MWLEEKKLTPYSLPKRTDGKISLSTAYRLKKVALRRSMRRCSNCSTTLFFNCEKLEELLERDKKTGAGMSEELDRHIWLRAADHPPR